LGRAIVNGSSPTNTERFDNTTTSNQTPGISLDSGLGSIDETVPLDDLQAPDSAEKADSNTGGPVTYRERLGGFLHPRDMRKLVSPFSASNEPELIVRRHAMLLNFDPLRAIILRDRVLVLVPDGADSLLVELEKRIRGGTQGEHGFFNSMTASESTPSLAKEETNAETMTEATEQLNEEDDGDSEYGDGEFISSFIDNEWEELEGKDWIDLPFELQSVDAVLHSVGSILADDVLDLQHAANVMIGELLNPNADVGDHAQDVLRTMKNSIKEMMSRVDGFCRALDTVLEDYEDMALMNLSRLLSHPERFVQPVPQGILEEESDEPELILEAQLQRGHTLTNALALVEGQISSTEDFAVRKSDTIRNRLLYINMVISVLSLSVAIGSFIGSIFGMNVVNQYEDSANAFRVIVLSTVGGALFFILASIGLIRWLGALPNLF
jgi:magnesium transporter